MSGERPTGLGVDATGGPVVDPTANVIALNEAGHKRQDDLRELNNKWLDAEIRVITARVQGVEDMALLRAGYEDKIRNLESDRLDKIRQVDVLAGNTAAERQLVAIQTLATQTANERETLRNLVVSTAATIAAQNSETVAQQNSRIAQLEKSSYEGAGKGTGTKNTVTYAIIAVGLLVSLITIGSVIVAIAFAIRR